MEGTVRGRFYLTKVLDVIPRLLPEGAWLSSLSFQAAEDGAQLKVEGMVFLGDPDSEFIAVNDIVLKLRNNPIVSISFPEIKLASMERAELERPRLQATRFTILCR